MRGFILICWQLIAKGLLLLCGQRKVIQSARILSKVRCCQRCYTTFCAVVVQHIDQNILTLIVFQRNKMDLHLLWVLFPDYSVLPWLMANRWGSIDYLVVCVCLCVRGCIRMCSLSYTCLHGKSQCGHLDSSAGGHLIASLPKRWTEAVVSQVKFQWKCNSQHSLSGVHQKDESSFYCGNQSIGYCVTKPHGFFIFLHREQLQNLTVSDVGTKCLCWPWTKVQKLKNTLVTFRDDSTFYECHLSLSNCLDDSRKNIQIRISSLIMWSMDRTASYLIFCLVVVPKKLNM